ncbi:bifunctional phosphopantothenoylcysteine decarboxylase/phosphopantothenate--cysteine ligase CoaBC [Candidatus Woesearchaeota archaeon]|nr:bifunctional phosphopantothenoylcysteine decarboxylase/phosphopantothenate--cysteine ligase CoaBC [Candidatus Woesearchaeota archaeon]
MKTIILGVTSSIACFKAVDLVKSLIKKHSLEVILTKSAGLLVNKTIFEKALGKGVYENLFYPGWGYKDYLRERKMAHIELADRADLFVVAPATANIIAKMAYGIADDLLTTSLLATKAPVLVCPAMNVNMWEHPVVQANVAALKKRGVFFVEPEEGMLACGWGGAGRLADLGLIEKEIGHLLFYPSRLRGKRILVTAGSTIEPIDPVRFIANRSSGKTGIAIAEEAARQGAEVILVRGMTSLEPGGKILDVKIETVNEMAAAIKKHIKTADVMIHAAAVSDFYAKEKSSTKIPSGKELALELSPTAKILEHVREWNPNVFLVGFKAEYKVSNKDLVNRARELLQRSRADLIVANDVGRKKIFGADSTSVVLVSSKKDTGCQGTKAEVSRKILSFL